MFKVAGINRRDVLTVEDSDFKFLIQAGGHAGYGFSAGPFEVLEGLENYFVSTNVSGDDVGFTFVRDELGWGGKIDAVDVSVPGCGSRSGWERSREGWGKRT